MCTCSTARRFITIGAEGALVMQKKSDGAETEMLSDPLGSAQALQVLRATICRDGRLFPSPQPGVGDPEGC